MKWFEALATGAMTVGLLTGCAALGQTPAPAAGDFCDIAKPIPWSPADTDETIRDVKSHNAVGKARCGWGS